MRERLLDLKGLKCPLPAMKTRQALARMAAGDLLVVAATDPLATLDIPHLVRETGDSLESQAVADGVATFHIRKRPLTVSETPG